MASRQQSDGPDRHGFDENRDYLGALVAKVIPGWLAHRAVTISVSTAQQTYELDEPVTFTVTIRNRLPVPVTLSTPQPRLWGWAVDGDLEATDEATYTSDASGTLALDGRETRHIEQEWNGRFERTGTGPAGQSTWVLPSAGTHELSVFLATTPPRAEDSVEIELLPERTE